MITGLDEYPLHQAPLPIAWSASSDRNAYDRCYLNAHDRTGDIFVITGLGYYPNLGTKDAFFLVRRGDVQTALHLGDPLDHDRLDQHVGPYRIEVVEPLRELRLTLEETEGIAADLTWRGSFDVVQEQPHLMRTGNRITLDAQRFAQVGTWEGTLSIDGEEIAVTPDRWVGTRDRSWGIRPVGESEPPGAPATPAFEGMWWLYVPMRFEEYAVVLIIQEDGTGHRSLNDCSRVWADGRVEQLGWPRVVVHYHPGGRTPYAATITCTNAAGEAVVLEVESRLAVPLHAGGGYGGDPDWLHGQWHGEKFVERRTYDIRDEAVQGRFMFGCVDHVGRAVLSEGGRDAEGWGLFEHFSIGRHDPSGFVDFFSTAP
jgi:hypothetical protein